MPHESKMENEVIKLLSERPISVSQLARQLNVRRDFLTGYLESMRDRGKLRVISVGKAHVYMIRGRRNE